MEGRVFKNFQKKFFKIPKMPKNVLKSIQTCFERVLGQIFRKTFLPSVPWRVEFSKIFKKKCFQNSKNAQNVLKSIQTCFKHVVGQTFRKIFAQFSMECRVFKKFQKKIFSKFQKCPKFFPKVSKRVLG